MLTLWIRLRLRWACSSGNYFVILDVDINSETIYLSQVGDKERLNTREIGTKKEEAACIYLEKNGVRIKERNFRSRYGEIDVIGYDGEYLVFFEVKYRKTASDKGSALEAVGIGKRKKICRVADYYRMIHRCPSDTPIRFDVIAIDGDNIQWVKNAFGYLNF